MDIFETRIKPQLEEGSFSSIDPQTLVESAEQIGQKLSSDEDGLKESSTSQILRYGQAN